MAGYMSDSVDRWVYVGAEVAIDNSFIWKQSVHGVERWEVAPCDLAHGAARSFACAVLAGRFCCSFDSCSFGFGIGFPDHKLRFDALVNAFGRY